MQKYLILQSQKNSILESIVNLGLNASDFEWREQESNYTKAIISVLIHRPTNYYFSFEIQQGKHFAEFSPGETLAIERSFTGSWSYQWAYLDSWLIFLKRELESPDLWSAIAQESELINATNEEDDNSPFNKEERKYIISGIDEIRQYLVKVHKINAEIIEPRLKYLEDASERLGRKDWKNILLSVIIGIILNSTVTPESSREILRFVGAVLHQILRHLTLLN